MIRNLWQASATRYAELFVQERGITELPVCPFAIAQKLEIEVNSLPSHSKGVSGMLLRHGNEFGILYATYLDNAGFQRFCISHELGHYCLPGHPESVLSDGLHTSHAGFISKDRYELEADHFAAGLLMPGFLFNPAMDEAGCGLNAIELLADVCNTSLTSTAIRYAQHTPEAAAIIISTGNEVNYCFMSDTLKELQGLNWLRKGTPLPLSTLTRTFNSNPSNVLLAKRDESETDLQEWFGSELNIEMQEEVIGLGGYGRTLTVVSTSTLPDQEELDEEDELIESWTPRFHR